MTTLQKVERFGNVPLPWLHDSIRVAADLMTALVPDQDNYFDWAKKTTDIVVDRTRLTEILSQIDAAEMDRKSFVQIEALLNSGLTIVGLIGLATGNGPEVTGAALACRLIIAPFLDGIGGTKILSDSLMLNALKPRATEAAIAIGKQERDVLALEEEFEHLFDGGNRRPVNDIARLAIDPETNVDLLEITKYSRAEVPLNSYSQFLADLAAVAALQTLYLETDPGISWANTEFGDEKTLHIRSFVGIVEIYLSPIPAYELRGLPSQFGLNELENFRPWVELFRRWETEFYKKGALEPPISLPATGRNINNSMALFSKEVISALKFNGMNWIDSAIDRACDAAGKEHVEMQTGIPDDPNQSPMIRKLRLIDPTAKRRGNSITFDSSLKLADALAVELGGRSFTVDRDDGTQYFGVHIPGAIVNVLSDFSRGRYPSLVAPNEQEGETLDRVPLTISL